MIPTRACEDDNGDSECRHHPQAARTARAADEIERLTTEADFVVTMVAQRYRNMGLPYDDLIAAGNLGLVEAAHRFDERRGVQFSTYASWWIRKEIFEALDAANNLIRVPRYTLDLRRQVLAHEQDRGESGEERTPEESTRTTGLSVRQVERASRPFARVEPLRPGREDGSAVPLEESIVDAVTAGPAERVLHAEALRALRGALDTLSLREQDVIALRYGVTGEEPMTLKQVARRLGLSKERMRQIQVAALGRLRRALAPPKRKRTRM